MDAGLAEAAAFGMGFKGEGSCKCRTPNEQNLIVPNCRNFGSLFSPIPSSFWSTVACLPDPLRMENAKMTRQNSRLTVLWPREGGTPVGDATDSDQSPPVSIDSIFCKRLYLFNPGTKNANITYLKLL